MSDVLAYHPNEAFTNKEKWAIASLILLSFTGISLLYIGKAMLTPFHIIMGFQIGYSIVVSKLDGKKVSVTLFLFLTYVILLNTYQFANTRITSVLYTIIYGVEITILLNLLSKCRIHSILFALRWIVYLFFANLLIAFFFDLIHFKQPQVLQFIRVYYSPGDVYGRPMGFSSEPSYASFILAVVVLSYAHLTKHKLDKDNLRLLALVFLSILLTKSAYGFLFLFIVIIDWSIHFYSNGDRLLKAVFPALLLIFLGLGTLFLSNTDNEALVRLRDFSTCLFDSSLVGKKKMAKLQEADGSAFARIAPTYLLFANDSSGDFNFTIGQGAGAAGKYLSKFLVGILIDEGRETVDTGIMPALVFDYGYIGSSIFLLFLIFSFQHLSGTFWLLFITIIPNANINTQLIWFVIACFAIVGKIIHTQNISPSNNLNPNS